MKANQQMQRRAVAYSFLAHIRNKGTFIDGPLDVFIPIVQNALSELYPDGTAKGATVTEISLKIEERFGLEIPIPVMLQILKKISKVVNDANGREDMLIYDDGSFIIERFIFEEYKEQIQESKDEVTKALNLFREFCSVYKFSSSDTNLDLIDFIEQNRADISSYLCQSPKAENATNNAAAQFIMMFRDTPLYETLKNIYLGSMLTTYLTYQPQGVSMDVELLLDTNFIVSLLDLNTPESTKTCSTLIKITQSLGYKFTVLKDTIDEFRGLLAYKAQNLNRTIIAKAINREDIYNACDRRNLTTVDLERIADNIEDTLREEFRVNIIPYTEKLRNKARYSTEYNYFKDIRTSEKSALHDAMAVLYVKERRGERSITEFDKVNCWFVNNAISHYGEYPIDIRADKKFLIPETIKVDNLLNIIWLSNPSIGLVDSELIDLGLASIVSYTSNAKLPKVRIIKELDENIQKYRNDYNITDKDVLRLSTRIAEHQINDIQSLNDLAKKDAVEFAARVKEEAVKQKELEDNRAQKIESLMQSMLAKIDELKQNKELQDKKYIQKSEALEHKEQELIEQTSRLSLKEQELEDTLQVFYKKEMDKRSHAWELYKNSKFQRRRSVWNYVFWLSVLIILGLLLLSLFLDSSYVVKILENKVLVIFGTLLGVFLEGVIFYNYNNWCHNPEYEHSYKGNLKRPKELQEITFDEFRNQKDIPTSSSDEQG